MMLFVTEVVELVHRAMQGNVFTVSSLGTFMRWRALLCTLPVFVKGEEMRYVYEGRTPWVGVQSTPYHS